MVRVTFTRVYRMYQPGETAGFSDREAATLIPAFGYDADSPSPQQVAAEKAEAEKAATEKAAAEKAEAEKAAAAKAKR